jgi:oligopeptide transport system substrate-binding protein
MVLKRNPLWPIPFTGNVDQVNIWWLPEDEANELWLEKSLDITSVSAEMREGIESSAVLRNRLRLITNQRSFYLAFNFDSPVLSEESVRRAFSAAIDREALIEEVFAGLGQGQRHFSPPGVVGGPPADIVGMGYNPDLARIEMANTSYRDCRFMPEVRYLVGTNDLDLFLAETIRDMWVRELNCQEEQIIIEQVQFGTLLANTRSDAGEVRPDLWNLGWSSFYPDAHNWLFDVLHCRGGENRPDRPCSEVDDVLSRASYSQDISERWELYRNAENLFFGEGGIAPIAPLLVLGEEFLVQTWVNFAPAQFGGEQYDTYQVAAEEKELERQQ